MGCRAFFWSGSAAHRNGREGGERETSTWTWAALLDAARAAVIKRPSHRLRARIGMQSRARAVRSFSEQLAISHAAAVAVFCASNDVSSVRRAPDSASCTLAKHGLFVA